MPEGFSVIGGEEAEFHEETVAMNQSFCLKRSAFAVLRALSSDRRFPSLFLVKRRIKVHSGKIVLEPIKEAACQREVRVKPSAWTCLSPNNKA
jgi:hypothetical protein